MPKHIIFIGPDKTGSSWFYEQLKGALNVGLPRLKEPFYFDRHLHLGPQWYEGLYSGDHEWRADISHDYLFTPGLIEKIDRELGGPACHLIVGVRDPIERAVSAFLYMKLQGRIRSRTPFLEALEVEAELLGHGDYGRHLEAIGHPAGCRVSFLDFRNLRTDPTGERARLFEAIGLDASLDAVDPARRVNSARASRSPRAMKAGRGLAGALRSRGFARPIQLVKDSRLVHSILYRDLGAADQVLSSEVESARAFAAPRVRESLEGANALYPNAVWPELIAAYR